MARSKLERFRDAQFPVAPDQSGEPWEGTVPSPARPPPARPAAAPRRRHGARRSGRGPVGRLYGALKLALFLAPLGFLLLTTFVDCGPRPSSVVPDFMRSTACARRDLTRHALSIDGTLKLVSDRLR